MINNSVSAVFNYSHILNAISQSLGDILVEYLSKVGYLAINEGCNK